MHTEHQQWQHPTNLLSHNLGQQPRLAGDGCHRAQAPAGCLQHRALLQVNLHVRLQLQAWGAVGGGQRKVQAR